ncbi:hypothetical protein ACUMKS_003750 [Proteus mirabilis]|uniref:hypothetical protein n=1 Tax=Proteus mirabilis TaxID=584 RepID=UPI001A1D2518|nr:hypothetical protein [Proteus mirabilis]HEM8286413.1 hypothetical protein [Providencia stuartii]EKU3804086.1 hypothetical protein [Proteus mirabilis]EKV7963321.1 hypothetical protein [Proteus mirabilis]ELB1172028.1 hypothetical protein [Proteus mirabilis]ELB2631286.1 hypothetical protein [Proteus mirabilis]
MKFLELNQHETGYQIISIFEYSGFYTYHIKKKDEIDQVIEFDSEGNVSKTSFKQNSKEEKEAINFIREIRKDLICSTI